MAFHVATPVLLAVSALIATTYGDDCCSRLVAAFQPEVGLPGSSQYAASTSFWAEQQTTLMPSCVVRPTDALQVSSVLGNLVNGSCPFAVRGGGHSSTKGASNINGGVLIDMRSLNATTPNANSSLATIGAGQIWGGAYSTLQAKGVTVPGGRNNEIGIAGSVMGGALGYIAPSVGWGSDSVVEFEVALADGRLVTASATSNSDLFRALKGGGSNFGIVTKLVMRTTPIGDIWISNSVYDSSAQESIIKAFHDFVADPGYDPKANLLMNYHYTADGGLQFANQYTYAAPVVKPAAYGAFYPIQGQVGNESAVTNIADYSVSQDSGSPDGFWQITFSTTFKNSIPQLNDVWDAFNRSSTKVAHIAGISWALTFEPITASLAAASKARGGNILGVTVPPEGLLLTLGSFTFNSGADYATAECAAKKLLSDIQAAAEKNGVYELWIDLNHAFRTQNPFKSYGDTNYDFLKATAKKYDPAGVFQILKPGGFKL